MIGLCLVGTGVIATEHMRALSALGKIRYRWVISRREEAAETFAQTWSFENHGVNLSPALADPGVDLVLITSPSQAHVEQTLKALQSGKDVIVEIPVALNLSGAEEVARLAAATKRRVLVCHSTRSFPGIREVYRRVRSGQLHLSHISGFFAVPRRNNQSRSGTRSWIDNLLWHHGCHQVDTALWMLGVDTVQGVRALSGKPHPQFGMAMDISIQFHTGAKQLVTIALTYNAKETLWVMRFLGDEDVLTFQNGKLLNEKDEQVVPEHSIYNMLNQDRAMIQAIRNNTPCDFDVASMMPAMRVLHQAEHSIGEFP